MTEIPAFERAFSGEFSKDEVAEWIDGVLDANKGFVARGINMSNSLYLKFGKPNDYKGVRVAMDADLYPDDVVRIVFDDAQS